MFSDVDVTPGNGVATNALGEFSMAFMVPGLEVGQHTLRVTVAGVTASSVFDISVPGVTPGAPTPVAAALGNLGDRLVRVFHFNDDTKRWTLYDPLLEDLNSLGVMVAGETYLVLVDETTEVVLNGRARNLTCLGGNCWNQIVW